MFKNIHKKKKEVEGHTRQMAKMKVFHKTGTLRSLTGTRPTKNKDNGDFFVVESWGGVDDARHQVCLWRGGRRGWSACLGWLEAGLESSLFLTTAKKTAKEEIESVRRSQGFGAPFDGGM
jgi:hypothetical protein